MQRLTVKLVIYIQIWNTANHQFVSDDIFFSGENKSCHFMLIVCQNVKTNFLCKIRKIKMFALFVISVSMANYNHRFKIFSDGMVQNKRGRLCNEKVSKSEYVWQACEKCLVLWVLVRPGVSVFYYRNGCHFCGLYRCVNSGKSLTNWTEPKGLYIRLWIIFRRLHID